MPPPSLICGPCSRTRSGRAQRKRTRASASIVDNEGFRTKLLCLFRIIAPVTEFIGPDYGLIAKLSDTTAVRDRDTVSCKV